MESHDYDGMIFIIIVVNMTPHILGLKVLSKLNR